MSEYEPFDFRREYFPCALAWFIDTKFYLCTNKKYAIFISFFLRYILINTILQQTA